ncbi:hypothetical protein BGW38_004632 [Lunasporangiospora selenospora]|uniref:AP-3 complex subunit delta domain-containing protein n=1 Tax=Lunasporangiospora selenospora TaxID=979761 RepID=A0A9P6FR12_9FUNG|nr:hypothetical protein BGW38_004632 [Lunasporangiospora selenospora]
MPKPPSVLGSLYPLFFTQELNPVAPKAQKKVPVPEGLDLDAWIHEPVPEPESESELSDSFMGDRDDAPGYGWSGEGSLSSKSKKKGRGKKSREDDPKESEARDKRKADRKERQKHDPYYIGDKNPSPSSGSRKKGGSQDEDLDVDAIPIVQLSMDGFSKPIIMDKKSKTKKKSKRRERSRSPPAVPVEFAAEEMPEDAMLSASDDEAKNKQTASAASGLNGRGILDQELSALHRVDLSIPVGEDEQLPRAKPYMKPDEVRRHEDELAQRRRAEAIQAKKEKKEKKDSKKTKSSKKDKDGADDGKPKKSSKKSKEKSKEENLIALGPSSGARAPSPVAVKAAPAPPPEPEKKSSKTKIKKSPKSSESTKKESSGTKKPKTPVIVTFPERAGLDLTQDDNMAVTYDIALSKTSLDSPITPGTESNIDPLVTVKIQVQNRSVSQSLSSVKVTLADSFDVRLGGAHSGQDTLSFPNSIDSQGKADVEMQLLIMGRVRYELRVMGTITYEVDGHAESLEFNLAIPPSIFMMAIPRLTGADFSKVLTEELEQFSATGSATVQLSTSTTGRDEHFWDAVEKVTRDVTRTHVVEVVDGAASFFGQSWQGYRIAGLIKVAKSQGSEEGGCKTMEVEMKCTDQSFVDGLALEVQSIEVY